MTNKGFIQIPLIWIVVAIIGGTVIVGSVAVLNKQNKSVPTTDNISEVSENEIVQKDTFESEKKQEVSEPDVVSTHQDKKIPNENEENEREKNKIEISTDPKPLKVEPVAISLSEVVQNFNDYYSKFNSPIHIKGTIIDLMAEEDRSTFQDQGDIVRLKDGNYRGTAWDLSNEEFQKLNLGDIVEIHGNLRQEPNMSGGYLVVHIYDTHSVNIVGKSSDIPSMEYMLKKTKEIVEETKREIPMSSSLNSCLAKAEILWDKVCFVANRKNGCGLSPYLDSVEVIIDAESQIKELCNQTFR